MCGRGKRNVSRRKSAELEEEVLSPEWEDPLNSQFAEDNCGFYSGLRTSSSSLPSQVKPIGACVAQVAAWFNALKFDLVVADI